MRGSRERGRKMKEGMEDEKVRGEVQRRKLKVDNQVKNVGKTNFMKGNGR